MANALDKRRERIDGARGFIKSHSNPVMSYEWLVVNLSLRLGVERRKTVEYLGLLEADNLIRISKKDDKVVRIEAAMPEEGEDELSGQEALDSELLPESEEEPEADEVSEPEVEEGPDVEEAEIKEEGRMTEEEAEQELKELEENEQRKKEIPKNHNPFKSR